MENSIQEIKKWLESKEQDFQQGISLLSKNNRRVLATNLGRKESEFSKSKLRYELAKIANVEVSNSPTEQATVQEVAKEKATAKPDKVEALYKEKAEIWSRESALRNKLHEFEESGNDGLALTTELQKQRQDLIDEITAYNDRRIEIESLVKVFEETGKLPETEEEIVEKTQTLDTAALFTRKQNLISYLSRENKKLLSLQENSEKYIATKEKIAKFQLEFDEIERILNPTQK